MRNLFNVVIITVKARAPTRAWLRFATLSVCLHCSHGVVRSRTAPISSVGSGALAPRQRSFESATVASRSRQSPGPTAPNRTTPHRSGDVRRWGLLRRGDPVRLSVPAAAPADSGRSQDGPLAEAARGVLQVDRAGAGVVAGGGGGRQARVVAFFALRGTPSHSLSLSRSIACLRRAELSREAAGPAAIRLIAFPHVLIMFPPLSSPRLSVYPSPRVRPGAPAYPPSRRPSAAGSPTATPRRETTRNFLAPVRMCNLAPFHSGDLPSFLPDPDLPPPAPPPRPSPILRRSAPRPRRPRTPSPSGGRKLFRVSSRRWSQWYRRGCRRRGYGRISVSICTYAV